jgi:lambda repressor-like predicted transcriptional regulator
MCARTLSLSLLAALLLLAAPASAHDSLAPPGAPHNWLPKEDWSAFHWSPFDELKLARLLGVTHRELYDYQADDHRTLAELAVARGIAPTTLREELIAPWKGHVTRAQLRVLRNHTSRMLTQGHLAQHMFWHPFHSPAFMRHADRAAHELYGVSIRGYRRLRRAGWTEVQIAARGGRTPAQLRRAITRHLEMESELGVRLHLTPRSQAQRMLARQRSLVNCWMSKPLPAFDPDIPFGDPFSHHGPHDRNSKIGIVFPKPAAGCWLPLVPLD